MRPSSRSSALVAVTSSSTASERAVAPFSSRSSAADSSTSIGVPSRRTNWYSTRSQRPVRKNAGSTTSRACACDAGVRKSDDSRPTTSWRS